MDSSDKKLVRIESKIDQLVDRMGSIDVTLGKQHESLRDHIRRTELLEKIVEPIEKHVIMINGFIKLLVLLATVAAGSQGIISILEYLNK